MLHVVLAVAAGYIAMAALVIMGTLAATALFVPRGVAAMRGSGTTQLPRSYLAANLTFSLVAAVAGGWVTARIAPTTRVGAIAGLVALVIVLNLSTRFGKQAGASPSQRGQPSWYQSIILAISLVGVLIGASLTSN